MLLFFSKENYGEAFTEYIKEKIDNAHKNLERTIQINPLNPVT